MNPQAKEISIKSSGSDNDGSPNSVSAPITIHKGKNREVDEGILLHSAPSGTLTRTEVINMNQRRVMPSNSVNKLY